MSKEGFDGFEVSAPKSIPSTRLEGSPPKKKKKKKRRRVENDPPMVKGMVIPNVPLATPVEAVEPVAEEAAFSLDDHGNGNGSSDNGASDKTSDNGTGGLFDDEMISAEPVSAIGPSVVIEPEPAVEARPAVSEAVSAEAISAGSTSADPAVVAEAQPAVVIEATPAVATAEPTEGEDAPRPTKKRKRVSDDPPRRALRDQSAVAETAPRARMESAWDSVGSTPNSDLARAIAEHNEAMLNRVLEKQMEIVRLQQKMIDQLSRGSGADDGEFTKKDAVFVGLVLFVLAAFALMFALKHS